MVEVYMSSLGTTPRGMIRHDVPDGGIWHNGTERNGDEPQNGRNKREGTPVRKWQPSAQRRWRTGRMRSPKSLLGLVRGHQNKNAMPLSRHGESIYCR